MDELTLIKYLSEFGFPAIVTAYLLIRQTKYLSDLTDSIKELNASIERNQVEIRLQLQNLKDERFNR